MLEGEDDHDRQGIAPFAETSLAGFQLAQPFLLSDVDVCNDAYPKFGHSGRTGKHAQVLQRRRDHRQHDL